LGEFSANTHALDALRVALIIKWAVPGANRKIFWLPIRCGKNYDERAPVEGTGFPP
jgi:hypothetical protein